MSNADRYWSKAPLCSFVLNPETFNAMNFIFLTDLFAFWLSSHMRDESHSQHPNSVEFGCLNIRRFHSYSVCRIRTDVGIFRNKSLLFSTTYFNELFLK